MKYATMNDRYTFPRVEVNKMLNVNKLKIKMIEQECNVTKLAKYIGVDESTVYRKLSKNGSEFTIKEAGRMAKHLNFSADDIMEIFFAHDVA